MTTEGARLQQAYARIEVLEREIAARRAARDGRAPRGRAAPIALGAASLGFLLAIAFTGWAMVTQRAASSLGGAAVEGPSRPQSWVHPVRNGAALLADLDGDGVDEVITTFRDARDTSELVAYDVSAKRPVWRRATANRVDDQSILKRSGDRVFLATGDRLEVFGLRDGASAGAVKAEEAIGRLCPKDAGRVLLVSALSERSWLFAPSSSSPSSSPALVAPKAGTDDAIACGERESDLPRCTIGPEEPCATYFAASGEGDAGSVVTARFEDARVRVDVEPSAAGEGVEAAAFYDKKRRSITTRQGPLSDPSFEPARHVPPKAAFASGMFAHATFTAEAAWKVKVYDVAKGEVAWSRRLTSGAERLEGITGGRDRLYFVYGGTIDVVAAKTGTAIATIAHVDAAPPAAPTPGATP